MFFNEHPTSETLYNIFNTDDINVVGINYEILDIIKKDNWKIFNINDEQKKVKEKVIIKSIKDLKLENIDIGVINTKYQYDFVILKK